MIGTKPGQVKKINGNEFKFILDVIGGEEVYLLYRARNNNSTYVEVKPDLLLMDINKTFNDLIKQLGKNAHRK